MQHKMTMMQICSRPEFTVSDDADSTSSCHCIARASLCSCSVLVVRTFRDSPLDDLTLSRLGSDSESVVGSASLETNVRTSGQQQHGKKKFCCLILVVVLQTSEPRLPEQTCISYFFVFFSQNIWTSSSALPSNLLLLSLNHFPKIR